MRTFVPTVDLTKWHKWFAWRPVKVNLGDIGYMRVWMETIYRKGEYSGFNRGDDWQYQFDDPTKR